MSNLTDQTSPRDMEELEGTLLPVVQAVPVSDGSSSNGSPQSRRQPHGSSSNYNNHNNNDVPIPVASATPATYFAYDAVPNSATRTYHDDNNGQQVVEAPVIPVVHGTKEPGLQQERQQRAEIAHGERTGRMDNEQQKQDIQRVNRQINALNYYTKKQTDLANAKANQLSRQERNGWEGPTSERPENLAKRAANQTYNSTATAEATSSSNKPKTKNSRGGYETAEYEVRNYDTNDYEITEYKSMYDD